MVSKITLGTQGLRVGRIGLGCMGMSQWYGATDDTESVRTLHRALELGVDFFDSAEAYGPFTNERLLQRAFAGRREEVVIATKFGFRIVDDQIVGVDSSTRNLQKVVDESLQRLGTDYIDVLYQHRLDPSIPIEDVVGAMGRFVEQGKVKYLGLCEVGKRTIERAHATHPISVIQGEYSLWERNVEEEILPLLENLGIGYVAFCPLGRGFLTGKAASATHYDASDFRQQDPRFREENFAANTFLTDSIQALAGSWSMTPAQLALAWLLTRSPHMAVIPGTKRVSYLEENVAADAVELTGEQLQAVETLLGQWAVAGARYEQRMMQFIDR
ncbi:aldo/keto reductase [Pseudomonas sp. W2Oct36]|jgi:aryl-alcohol dehydrogenase-like predicted oxidoreductase|uniref:aldo/keto reductase n=1 Tax=unclassified Pseudomonas TaxID=196821 RepID=UPI0010DABA83|nr:aldo/keto reductase [Pseudomonas sp. CFBP 8772]MBD8596648.1 aldo/keto reductase [Pseudomonas sp. CFBP 8772]RZA30841.1 MAG: aldo/keto reductase [Pseudomonadota bacterium]